MAESGPVADRQPVAGTVENHINHTHPHTHTHAVIEGLHRIPKCIVKGMNRKLVGYGCEKSQTDSMSFR